MIVVNIDKAKNIVHTVRREKRADEFAPLDIKATIPSEANAAETSRQAIREKYATIQASIDAASDISELTKIIKSL
jgi:hypothetical protein